MKAIFGIVVSNLRQIPSRIGQSLVIVVSTACVVGVLTGLLAIAVGFERVFSNSAGKDRILFVRKGTVNELQSNIVAQEWDILSVYEDVANHTVELYSVVKMKRTDSNQMENIGVRGVPPSAFDLRPEVNIQSGRGFDQAVAEAIVGVDLAGKYEGLGIGETFFLGSTPVTVVGYFAASGTIYEGEVWMDLPVAQSLFQRFYFSVVHAVSRGGLSSLRERIESDPQLDVEVWHESEFYSRQAHDQVVQLEYFGYGVALIIALGAVAAILSTMHYSVSKRTAEIAILRTLGFGQIAIISSVLSESIVLSVIGAVLGCGSVYLALNGNTALSVAATPVAFDFAVTPGLMANSVAWAIVLGIFGGLLPAIRAVRLSIATGLQRSIR